MGLDINKIIAESVQEFEGSNEVLTESSTYIQESEEVPSCLYTMFESALVPSIAAGMGALNLRTRLRNLNESNGVMDTINENGQDIIVKSIANAAIGFLNENRAATLMDQNLLEISDQWKARLKTAGKVAGGAAALGAAVYGAYRGNEALGNPVGKGLDKAGEWASEKFNNLKTRFNKNADDEVAMQLRSQKELDDQETKRNLNSDGNKTWSRDPNAPTGKY